MNTEIKLALCVGGASDGRTKSIAEVVGHLACDGDLYAYYGSLTTRNIGKVEVYVLDDLTSAEAKRLVDLL
jgi:hypothetical protein